MPTSVFDLFKFGIGPSSSHTMGPMLAAGRFVKSLQTLSHRRYVCRIVVKLYGSLALTGKGHATDRGVILGLAGFVPETYDPVLAEAALQGVLARKELRLAGRNVIAFDHTQDIVWAGQEKLHQHPNALAISAFCVGGELLLTKKYFSVGGGFVRDEDDMTNSAESPGTLELPFAFESGAQLLEMGRWANLSIDEMMMRNELQRHTEGHILSELDRILTSMDECIDRGLEADGVLPGGLGVKRRAKAIHKSLLEKAEKQLSDPLAAMDFVNVWALAVNEENAAGGRVVTAPTNGAAGIIPAVLRYFSRFHANGDGEANRKFLLVAAAIGSLYKRNASISGAEVGCQGEVGVACSMAAAGLCAALGGSNEQVENAAEIAMEHNLGLTCDPIGGLVQIPCIERNAMGAVKAIDSARLSLLGDGVHSVSLDKVIATMKRTGADMNHIYKETSLGGLAAEYPVNRIEC